MTETTHPSNENPIPIVFATDDAYVMPTSVAIRSLVRNYSGKQLLFFILSKNTLSQISRNTLIAASQGGDCHCRFEFRCVDESMLTGVQSHLRHITVATYYRLLIPHILSDYPKCLYLDGDICVEGDVAELLALSLQTDEYVAGVVAFESATVRHGLQKRLETLGIDHLGTYVNAGVLLMNLKALRANDVPARWLDLARKGFPLQDQDVINAGCFNHICLLPPKYNVMPSMYSRSEKALGRIYGNTNVREGKQKPVIVHFASQCKPWLCSGLDGSASWEFYYSQMHCIGDLKRKSAALQQFKFNWIARIANFRHRASLFAKKMAQLVGAKKQGR